MAKKTFKFYSVPGHGWLAVKRKFLQHLGILWEVTCCSYQRGGTVYLEEDVDVGTFMKAYKDKYRSDPQIETVAHNRSYIRRYENFSLTPEEHAYFFDPKYAASPPAHIQAQLEELVDKCKEILE